MQHVVGESELDCELYMTYDLNISISKKLRTQFSKYQLKTLEISSFNDLLPT
jgi:hypothetical protein